VFLGGQQNLQDPQSLNAYSYSENNPIVREDPLGKFEEFDFSGTDFGFSGQMGVQYTLSPLVINLTDAGGARYGAGGFPLSFSAQPGPVPQPTGPITTYGTDAALVLGGEYDTSDETYNDGTVNVEDKSTVLSPTIGLGADVYLRKEISIPIFGSPLAILGAPQPQGAQLVSNSNFSTPNYAATSPSIYYSTNGYISAALHAGVPQSMAAPAVPVGGGGGSLPATVTQGGTTYYRNSSGLLSTTPGR
jgi:hypothetical protein